MRRVFPAGLLLFATVQQACQRDEATAPRLAADATGNPGRAPAHLTFTTQPPEGVNANTAISPAVQVTVTGASGDVVPGGAVRLQLGTSPVPGAKLSGTTEARIEGGVAAFADLRINSAGRGYTLLAKAGPVSSVSARFAVVGPPTKLAFVTQPPATVEGTVALSPAVRVAIQDALGSPVPGATQAVTLALAGNPSGVTLAGTTTVNAVDGIATFADLSVDLPGSGYTLAVTASGLTGAASTAFAVHLTFATVSAGDNHTCGLTTSHAAYCWGAGGVQGGAATGGPTPELVAGAPRFTTLSAGLYHTCGLSSSGVAYCWGSNLSGQLGDGTTTLRASPVLVAGGLTFTTLSAGPDHTCGLSSSGAAYCWGRPYEYSPTPVAGAPSFTAIGAGADHTCGLTAGGAAYCWGNNYYGQLGDGTRTDRTTPGPVAGGLSFTTISVGGAHTCGVASDGASYCWGRKFKDFGPGEDDPSRIFGLSPTPLPGGLSFTAVDSRLYFHGCGVTATGAAYCWGMNDRGQLGDDTHFQQQTPVPVAGGLAFAAVSVGYRYTCGVTPNGRAYCWGHGTEGQLGNGSAAGSSSTPTAVIQ